jgi:hypothetical protein
LIEAIVQFDAQAGLCLRKHAHRDESLVWFWLPIAKVRCGGKKEDECMSERMGRLWQGVALFAMGALVGAVLLGGGSFALSEIGDGAQAQTSQTWETKVFDEMRFNLGATGVVDPDVYFNDWLHTIPRECHVETVEGALGNFLAYYSCP